MAQRLLLALWLVAGFGAAAWAQDSYPSRPVTLVVPYSAGGSIDLVARIVAEGLSARLGQSFVVDNKPGGNGTIGIGAVVKSKPDGYTLQMGAVGANVTPAIVQKNYPFDPLRDYVPISIVAEWSAILAVKRTCRSKRWPSSSPTLGRGRACSTSAPPATAALPISSANCSCSRPALSCSTFSTRAGRRQPRTCFPARSMRT
jgi:tripartite-type tricarboxylate transporter receptor subunit TctC